MKATLKRGTPAKSPIVKSRVASRAGRPVMHPDVRTSGSAVLTVPLWKELRAAVRQAAFDNEMSMSGFVRRTIIRDLRRTGYLKDDGLSK